MSGRLAREIQQTRPFSSPAEEAFLNLARTFEFLRQNLAEVFREYDLSATQYNMLRILRGAGENGITCTQAAERMLSPDPDITRLLDRMEKRNLIARERSREDRRVTITRITGEGLAVVDRLDEPVREFLRRYVGRVGRQKLAALIEVLEELREPIARTKEEHKA